MRKSGAYFEGFGEKAVKIIAFVLLAVLTVWTASYTCCYPLDYSAEYMTIHEDSLFKNLAVAVMAMVAFWGLSALLFRGKNEEQKKKIVWYFAIAETFLIGLALTVWVTQTGFQPNRDAKQVYGTALEFLQGDYTAMTYNYIQGFQQQLNLVFLEELILKIGGDYGVFQYLNVICIMAIVFFLYRITDKIFQNQIVNFYCLIGTAGFLPMYFYSNLVYGDVCSIALSIVAIWALLNWLGRKKKRHVAVAVVCLTVATLARKNTLIILVAIFICLLIHAWKESSWQAVVVGALISAVLFGSMQLIPHMYEKRSGVELGDAMPSIMWIAMGTQGDWGGHGVYNAYNESVFWSTGGNAKEASALAMNTIKERMQEFANNPALAKDFYKNKMLEQWGEPTYGSMILTYEEQDAGEGVKAIYTGSIQGKLISIQNYYGFIVYFSVLLFIVGRIKKKDNIWQMLLLIVVVGGILFSIIWETKSRYVFPYVICMIPYMACGMWMVQEGIRKLVRKAKELKNKH